METLETQGRRVHRARLALREPQDHKARQVHKAQLAQIQQLQAQLDPRDHRAQQVHKAQLVRIQQLLARQVRRVRRDQLVLRDQQVRKVRREFLASMAALAMETRAILPLADRVHLGSLTMAQ